MSDLAEQRGFGRKSITYRLRDWGISRQRYWGTPIPVIFCDRCGIVGVPYEDLPVELPHDVAFTGEEGSPLEKVPSFVETTCPKCGGPARRETDTMDTFFDSSWYFFRYTSPHKDDGPFDPAAASYWLPVDLYIGGVEHAILHLIYARFFTRVLRDLGYSSVSEPFPHYLAQGMVTKDGSAMSKSKGNVVDPDDMLKEYGADALRLFILFASPPEKEFAWNEDGIEGCSRFLNRIWALVQENLDLFQAPGSPEAVLTAATAGAGAGLLKRTHQTIRKVTEDIGKRFHLNTAISALMELYNLAKKEKDGLRQTAEGRAVLKLTLEAMVVLLSPFTPHICEELWEMTGHRGVLARQAWPAFDPELAKEETVTVVVQINGKLKDRFEVNAGAAEDEIRATALGLERVSAAMAGKTVRKVICIGNRLVNIVVS